MKSKLLANIVIRICCNLHGLAEWAETKAEKWFWIAQKFCPHEKQRLGECILCLKDIEHEEME